MTIHPLTNEERATLGGTHRAIITYADLVTLGGATNTATQALFTTPLNSDGTYTPNKQINLVETLLTTPFTGSDGTLISTAMTVGDSGNNARLLASQELNAANTPVWNKGGALTSNAFYVPTAQTTVNAYFTATVGKLLNTLTAGEVQLIFEYIPGPVPSNTTVGSMPQ